MDVIIVGAGIAGLSAGVGLRKAGHKVTVGSFSIWLSSLPMFSLSGPLFSPSQAQVCMYVCMKITRYAKISFIPNTDPRTIFPAVRNRGGYYHHSECVQSASILGL